MLKLPHLPAAHLLLGLMLFLVSLFGDATQATPQINSSSSTVRIGIPEQQSFTLSQGSKSASLINFSQEFWQIWAIDHQKKIEFIYLAPQKMAQALKEEKIDIIGLSLSLAQKSRKDITYSIPYLKYKQQLFRRINKNNNNNNGMKVGIHTANFKILDFLSNNISKEYFFNPQDLLAQQDKFDALYSSQPWLLSEKMGLLNIQDQFYKNEHEFIDMYFHFVMRKSDTALGLLVNKSLRRISKLQALAWQNKYFENSLFSLTLGEYIADLTPEEESYLLNHHVLHYPITKNGNPPYIINKRFSNISVNGFSVDIAKEITKRTGLIFKPYNVKSLTADMSANKYLDILLQSPKLSSAANNYHFSAPYTDINYSIVTRKNTPIHSRFSALMQKKIGAIKGTNAASLIQTKFPNTTLKLYTSIDTAIEALSHQKIDYLVADSMVAAYAVQEKGLTHIVSPTSSEGFSKIKLSFAALKPSDNLLSIINKSLNSFSPKTVSQLAYKWNKSSYIPDKTIKKIETSTKRPAYFIWGIILVTLGGLWFLYRQYNYRTLHHKAIEKALTIAESAKLEAEKSAEAKITFLARMSHEIRTPMNGVLGMAEALTYTDLDANQQDLLETLNSSASNLLALLNDVLDFSKMDAGKLTLESVPVNLTTLCTRITNSFKHVENEKSLKIQLDIDSNINESYFIDPTRITQVLNNLISNAIKFTHQGSVALHLKLLEQDQKSDLIYDTISISVKDTGIGIAPKNQGSLFTPFIQADDDITRKFGGTGLGLSICHEIVSAMGSIILLDSQLNEGCDFYFNLKLKQANNNNQEERRKNFRTLNATNDNRFDHLRVLIAEDNLINIQVLSAQLKRLNITADIAYDGAQALEMHTQQPYDIIISDCHMPKMDGFELANIISQAKDQLPIWLIAITADALKGASKKCIAAGFDDYMSKPCSQEQITNKLNHAYRQLIIKRESDLIAKLKEAPYVLFDPHALFLLHDNDIVLSKNLAEVFINTWHKEKEHFLAELAHHNFQQLYALAHKQKSVVRYLCGNDIEGIIIELEKHAQSKNIVKTQKSCLLLIKQFDILHTEINHWLTTLSQHNRFFRLR